MCLAGPLETRPLYRICYLAEFVLTVETNTMSVIAETFRVPLSRSLKVIETDAGRSSTYYFLFDRYYHGPISYCF